MKLNHAAFAATALLAFATPGVTAVAKTLVKTATPTGSGTAVAVHSGSSSQPSFVDKMIASPVNIDRFDTTSGILTGAILSVDMAVSATLASQVTNAPANTIAGTASSRFTTSISGAGLSNLGVITGPTLQAQQTCSRGLCGAPTGTMSGRIESFSAISAFYLKDYAGSGKATLSVNGSGFVSASKLTPLPGTLTTTATVLFGTSSSTTGTNEVKMTYSYLDFASPSFSSTDPTVRSLALDFGTLTAGSAAKTLTFSLTNIGGDSTAGLSLKSIVTTGSGFTTDLTTFSDGLAGGQSGTWSVTLAPTTAGAFDQYLALMFEDFAPGGVGMRSYQLNLRAFGSVAAAAVPEPASWAMMIAGFGLVGIGMRRRNVVSAIA